MTRQYAQIAAKRGSRLDRRVQAYKCKLCGSWHVGHSSTGNKNPLRPYRSHEQEIDMNETSMSIAMKQAALRAPAAPSAGTALSKRERVWRLLKDTPSGMTVKELSARIGFNAGGVVTAMAHLGLLESKVPRAFGDKRRATYFALGATYADALALKPGLKSPAKAETTAPKEPVPSPTQAGRGEATPFGLPKEVLHMNLEQLLNLRSALNALFSPGSSV